ncbi:MAG: hypothetical protein J6R47_01090 [Acholeplasmatales bacterium]|nr:hypothetical protein [Acholeplasmatales bacterium]
MNNCPFELYIPDVGICCKAYYESKRSDGKEWCHFPRCYDDKCPLKHPELLEGAKLEGIEI